MPTEHVQSSSRLAQRRRTDERIVTVAAELFLGAGYRSTTVRRIAEAAEVSVGRVMAVGDKDALLIACYDRWIADLQAGTHDLPRTRTQPAAASAVHDHLLGIFLPFLEFFASHEDLSRDYAAALLRVRGRPEVFAGLAGDLQNALTENFAAIGISRDNAQASAAALYDAYLGVLFRWAAGVLDFDAAVKALSGTITVHTRLRGRP